MAETEPDSPEGEREEPEEQNFDPYTWLSLVRVEVAEDLQGVPFN